MDFIDRRRHGIPRHRRVAQPAAAVGMSLCWLSADDGGPPHPSHEVILQTLKSLAEEESVPILHGIRTDQSVNKPRGNASSAGLRPEIESSGGLLAGPQTAHADPRRSQWRASHGRLKSWKSPTVKAVQTSKRYIPRCSDRQRALLPRTEQSQFPSPP